jgi:hypothetical protein
LGVMDYNLHVDSMQQIQHKSFEQNPCLMKISAKKSRPLGLPSSKALITNEMRESASVCKLHYMEDKNFQQNVGLVASGQQRKVHW